MSRDKLCDSTDTQYRILVADAKSLLWPESNSRYQVFQRLQNCSKLTRIIAHSHEKLETWRGENTSFTKFVDLNESRTRLMAPWTLGLEALRNSYHSGFFRGRCRPGRTSTRRGYNHKALCHRSIIPAAWLNDGKPVWQNDRLRAHQAQQKLP